MSTLARPRRHHTYAEYLAYEADSGMKHEYDAGDIVAMAGGSLRHNQLAAAVTAALYNRRSSECRVFQSDQRIRITATGKSTYPDVSMVCGAIELDPADPSGATITNPTVIVEVLSPSTEQDDRGSKWQHYQQLASLHEYVLVSQAERRIEHYRRLPNGGWEYREHTEGVLKLDCGPALEIAVLYADLPP